MKVLEDWEVREVLGGLGDSRRPRRFKEARDHLFCNLFSRKL